MLCYKRGMGQFQAAARPPTPSVWGADRVREQHARGRKASQPRAPRVRRPVWGPPSFFRIPQKLSGCGPGLFSTGPDNGKAHRAAASVEAGAYIRGAEKISSCATRSVEGKTAAGVEKHWATEADKPKMFDWAGAWGRCTPWSVAPGDMGGGPNGFPFRFNGLISPAAKQNVQVGGKSIRS